MGFPFQRSRPHFSQLAGLRPSLTKRSFSQLVFTYTP
jgi:hypothetical protein